MSLSLVSYGLKAPDEINVIIEIPAHSAPIKYEVDKETGALFVDRFLSTSMRYPCDYGYVPHTLSEDGDPVDVIVVSPMPLHVGVVITCRPIGVLSMTDEAGPDAKVLAVPVDALSKFYKHVEAPEDIPPPLLEQIGHFFAHYKDLENDKWVKLEGWLDAAHAKQEILDSIKRFQDAPDQPAF